VLIILILLYERSLKNNFITHNTEVLHREVIRSSPCLLGGDNNVLITL